MYLHWDELINDKDFRPLTRIDIDSFMEGQHCLSWTMGHTIQ
jgi:hypothetical protein